MMSKTHIAIGIASSIALTQPKKVGELLGAIVGGSIGGLISDIEVKSNAHPKSKNVLHGRIIVAAITAFALAVDFIMKAGICDYIQEHAGIPLIIGTVAFVVVCLIMRNSAHRAFSHSFLALILLSIALGLLCAPLVPYFAIGFLSHLILDVMNKRPIQLFSPFGKGLCFNMFYADRVANTVLLYIGLVSIILLFIPFLMGYMG
jgi:inner membrane protein